MLICGRLYAHDSCDVCATAAAARPVLSMYIQLLGIPALKPVVDAGRASINAMFCLSLHCCACCCLALAWTDPCFTNTCQNRGICIYGTGGRCACNHGWSSNSSAGTDCSAPGKSHELTWTWTNVVVAYLLRGWSPQCSVLLLEEACCCQPATAISAATACCCRLS
jgi:hypothetical protein